MRALKLAVVSKSAEIAPGRLEMCDLPVDGDEYRTTMASQ